MDYKQFFKWNRVETKENMGMQHTNVYVYVSVQWVVISNGFL